MLNVVTDFGAVGDGVADDTSAIQAAVNANNSGSTILFPAGTYKISSPISVASKGDFVFLGRGATIKGTTTRFQSYFHITGSGRITFKNLIFDQMKSSLPTYTSGDYANIYNCPIYFDSGSNNLLVEGCKFLDLYTIGIFCYDASDILIKACSFNSAVQTQTQMMQHVHVQTCGGLLTIKDSEFINAPVTSPNAVPCGIFVSGQVGSSFIENNRFEYCGRNNAGSHRLGVIDFYGDATNVHILNNVSMNGMAQFMRLAAIRNGIVQGNRVHINGNAELDYSTLTIESVANGGSQEGVQDMQILDNVFEDPSHRAAFTVGALSYHWDYPNKNIKIMRNSFSGTRRAVYIAGPFSNVAVESNDMRDYVGSIEVVHNGTNAAGMVGGTESTSAFDGLSIRNNMMRDSSGGGSNAVTISLSKSPQYTGTVGRMVVEDNTFHADSTNAGQAIAAIVNASTAQGRLLIRGNETQKYDINWYVRGTAEVEVERNRAISTGSSTPYLDDGTNGVVLRRGNRLSNGRLFGTATLIAGSATVSTSEIRTGDSVALSRTTAGGTLGDLSVGTITSGISFTVSSTSGSDTSSVFWEIVH